MRWRTQEVEWRTIYKSLLTKNVGTACVVHVVDNDKCHFSRFARAARTRRTIVWHLRPACKGKKVKIKVSPYKSSPPRLKKEEEGWTMSGRLRGWETERRSFFLFNQTVVSEARPRIAAACETINKIDPRRPTTTDDDGQRRRWRRCESAGNLIRAREIYHQMNCSGASLSAGSFN